MAIQVFKLKGQPVLETPEAIYIWVRKGPYLTAGRGLWPGSPLGFGINREILDLATMRGKPIRIINGDRFDRCYEATGQHWFKFVLKHNATMERKGVKLYLLQFSPDHFKTIRMDVRPIIVRLRLED